MTRDFARLVLFPAADGIKQAVLEASKASKAYQTIRHVAIILDHEHDGMLRLIQGNCR